MTNEQPQGMLPVNKEETDLIRSVFKDNENLLKVMRALFLGLGVSQDEKNLIKSTFSNGTLVKVIENRFLPSIDKDMPIGQVADVWLGAEQMIFGAHKDTITQAVGYKEQSIQLTRQAIGLLENPDNEAPSIEFKGETDVLGVSLLARNQFIRHVEQQLLFLKMIAEQKEETEKEKKERMAKDSTI